MLFSKSFVTPAYFKKGGQGSILFRKGLNTLDEVARNAGKVSNFATLATPAITAVNRYAGGISARVGLNAGGLSQALGSVVNQGRSFRKSIERG